MLTSIHHASSKENQTLDLFVGKLSKKTMRRIKDNNVEVRDHNGGE